MGAPAMVPLKDLSIAGGLVGGPFGSNLVKRDYVVDGIPVIRGQNLSGGGYFSSRDFVFVSEEKVERDLRRNLALPGDVVFTQRGTLGQVGIVPEGRFDRYVVSQSQMRMRVDRSQADARFIYYWFRSPAMQELIRSRAIATGVPHINLGILSGLPIPRHPIGAQRAIAEVLGALDDKIALNERIGAAALELGDAYYQVMGQGEGVKQTMLGQLVAEGVLELGDGYRTKKAEYGKPGLPILRVAEVGDGEIRPSFGDHVREEFRRAMGQKTSRAGDVILTTKGTVGRVALMSPDDPEFVYSPQVCYFRTNDDVQASATYLFHWMRGSEFWSQAAGMKGQTDMADYLSLSDIRSLKISLPARSALIEFDRRCAPLHARAEAARLENRTLTELRDTLLPELVTGKLRVKDAARAVEEVV
ncbi:restriction endonuclease subunit S [Streptomyces sp. NPDC006544]|uniref:restriction endonuclease subunit S n=1 Tax=Streptomyces sp. NPDC006544 TaxID=3154583 RepID=UPI00339F035B